MERKEKEQQRRGQWWGGGTEEKSTEAKDKRGGERERQRRELGAVRSVLAEVRRIINEISKFSGHCGGMGSCRHTAEPCWTKDKLPVNNMF